MTTRSDLSAAAGPVRTCVGCRRRRPQDELVRLVADDAGRLRSGRSLPGRGAWLCRDRYEACGSKALERRGLARALKVSLPADAVLPPGP